MKTDEQIELAIALLQDSVPKAPKTEMELINQTRMFAQIEAFRWILRGKSLAPHISEEPKPRILTIREFCDFVDRETWKGTSTAFRNGVRCRLEERAGNYEHTRPDLYQAWKRGWTELDLYLTNGNVILR